MSLVPRYRLRWMVAIVGFVGIFGGCGEPKPKDTLIPTTKTARNEKEKKVLVEMAKLANLQGLEACEKGAYEEAIRHFRHAIENDDHPSYFNNLGRALYWTGRYEDALRAYEIATKKNPDDPDLLTNMADVYRQLKNTTRAIELYHAALNIDPNFVRAHFELGDLYLKEAQYKSAEYRLQKVIELDPSNSRALLSRAILYHMTGRSREAWRDIQVLERRGFQVQPSFRREVLERIGLSDEKATEPSKSR